MKTFVNTPAAKVANARRMIQRQVDNLWQKEYGENFICDAHRHIRDNLAKNITDYRERCILEEQARHALEAEEQLIITARRRRA